MARMQIALKGGAVIEADVSEVVTARDRFTGALTRIKWTTPEGAARRLHTVSVDEIAAVVLVDFDSDTAPAKVSEVEA